MTAVYLLSQEGEILALDAVDSIAVSRDNNLTKSSTMSGTEISDGYTIGNKKLAFGGICSYTKISRGAGSVTPPNPAELNTLLDSMVDSKTRFTLYGNSLIQTLKDMVIISHTVTADKYSNAITVSIGLEQAFISDSADWVYLTRPNAKAVDELPENRLAAAKAAVSAIKQQKEAEILRAFNNTYDVTRFAR